MLLSGETARKLIDGVRQAGGRWTAGELAYRSRERTPIRFEYRG